MTLTLQQVEILRLAGFWLGQFGYRLHKVFNFFPLATAFLFDVFAVAVLAEFRVAFCACFVLQFARVFRAEFWLLRDAVVRMLVRAYPPLQIRVNGMTSMTAY